MRLVIVTGMSGAGKTTALKTLEDMGFYCADNLPVLLIEKFAELVMNGQSEKQDIALGVDVRSGEELPNLEIIIRKWRENKYPFSILFLDSAVFFQCPDDPYLMIRRNSCKYPDLQNLISKLPIAQAIQL